MRTLISTIFTRFRKSTIALIAILSTVAFAASDCEEAPPESDGNKSESKTQRSNYDTLVKNQPAKTMTYSPTRDTKNFWISTWADKGKVSYVYLLSGGKPYAFAVFKRLPVTYCVGLVPPVQKVGGVDHGEFDGEEYIPAPSIDGTYSSSSNCGSYYGEDATTGAYVEFTAGADTTMLLRDQPLPINLYADALPLGDTTAQQASGVDDSKTTTP